MRNNKNTKFKRTEIGMIPSDWEVVLLGNIATVTKLAGFEFTAYIKYQDKGNIIALRGLNIKKGKLVLNDVKYIDGSDFTKLNRSKLYIGDMLFTYIGTVGELALVDKDNKYYLAPNVALIRFETQREVSKFYLYLFQFTNFQISQINPLIASSTQPALTMHNIRQFKVVKPPKPEQEKIANALMRIDNLIEDYEKLIKKKEKIKQGLMQNLLTGKVRLKGLDEKWYQFGFNQVLENVSTSGKKIQTSEYKNSGIYPVVDQGQDVIVGYSNDSKKVIDLNEVIIFGDHTRIFKYVKNKFIVGADGVRVLITKEKFDTHYIYYLLLTQEIPNTGYNRHFKYVKDLMLKLPELKEQQAISQVLSNADNEIDDLKIKLNKITDIKKGMLDNLLTGKIRL